jgi:hypothetical protein
MPSYNNAPPEKSVLIEQGWPVYLFGSRQSVDGQYFVTSVAITSNVATIGVTGWSGPLPVVGGAVSIVGTQTNSNLFNVTNKTIASVSIDETGTGTLTFALVHANVATTTDVGTLYVRAAPVGEAITSAGASSIAGSVGNAVGRNANWLSASVYFPSAPSAATVTLQGSNTNNDADFVDIATITLTSFRGGAEVETNYEFVRFNVSGVTGTGTIVGSINA